MSRIPPSRKPEDLLDNVLKRARTETGDSGDDPLVNGSKPAMPQKVISPTEDLLAEGFNLALTETGISDLASTVPTLADVLAAVKRSEKPERVRDSQVSAIKILTRGLGRSPEDLPANSRELRHALKRLSPAALDISPRTLRNYRSLFASALREYARTSPGRYRTPLSPSWAAVFGQLTTRASRYGTSAFVHSCSARNVEPESVTAQTFEEFRFELLNSFRKNPEQAYSIFRRAWSKAQRENERWPRAIARCPERRDHWVFPWDSFPDSLHRDARIWLDRLAGRDLKEGPARPVRPATLKHREWQLRVLATAAVLGGIDVKKLRRLTNLVELETLNTALRFLLDRRQGATSTGIADIAVMAKAVAKHYVRVDADHLNRIGKMARRLEPGRGEGLTEKVKALLRQLKRPENLATLQNLPGTLLCDADRARKSETRRRKGAAGRHH